MSKKPFTVSPMWELGLINVFLEGKDEAPDGVFFVPSRPLDYQRTDLQCGSFEHGLATHGNLDLTIEQAESLAQQLLDAAQEMRRMDYECEEGTDNVEDI